MKPFKYCFSMLAAMTMLSGYAYAQNMPVIIKGEGKLIGTINGKINCYENVHTGKHYIEESVSFDGISHHDRYSVPCPIEWAWPSIPNCKACMPSALNDAISRSGEIDSKDKTRVDTPQSGTFRIEDYFANNIGDQFISNFEIPAPSTLFKKITGECYKRADGEFYAKTISHPIRVQKAVEGLKCPSDYKLISIDCKLCYYTKDSIFEHSGKKDARYTQAQNSETQQQVKKGVAEIKSVIRSTADNITADVSWEGTETRMTINKRTGEIKNAIGNVMGRINQLEKTILDAKGEIIGHVDDKFCELMEGIEELKANQKQMQCSIDEMAKVQNAILQNQMDEKAERQAKALEEAARKEGLAINSSNWRAYKLCKDGKFSDSNMGTGSGKPDCYIFPGARVSKFYIGECNAEYSYQYTVTRNANECADGARTTEKVVDGKRAQRVREDYCYEKHSDVIVKDARAAEQFLAAIDPKGTRKCSGHKSLGEIKSNDKNNLYLVCILPTDGSSVDKEGSFMTYKFRRGDAAAQQESWNRFACEHVTESPGKWVGTGSAAKCYINEKCSNFVGIEEITKLSPNMPNMCVQEKAE